MLQAICFHFLRRYSLFSLFKHLTLKLWRVAFLFRILYSKFLWADFLMSAYGFKSFYTYTYSHFLLSSILVAVFGCVQAQVSCMVRFFHSFFFGVFQTTFSSFEWLNGELFFATISKLCFEFVLYVSLLLFWPCPWCVSTIKSPEHQIVSMAMRCEIFSFQLAIIYLRNLNFSHRASAVTAVEFAFSLFSFIVPLLKCDFHFYFLFVWNAFVNIY